MRVPLAAAICGLTALGISACSDYDSENQAYAEGANDAYAEGAQAGGDYAGGTAASGWPEGTRIVVEEGVTYRIEPGGARIRLGPGDSRVLVEDGVTFRVDPDGTRVRIDPQGAEIRAEPGDVNVNAGDTSVEVNNQ